MRARQFLLLPFVLATVVATSAQAPAATSGSVVGANVLSATSLDIDQCQTGTPGVTEFGSLMPGTTTWLASECVVEFHSSNDTSSLRVAQADGAGRAMWQSTNGALDTAGFASPLGYAEGIGVIGEIGKLVRLEDGSLVAPGTSGTWPNMHATLQKYAPDGTLDTTFGSPNGWVTLDLGIAADIDRFTTVIVQPDGKLVAAGSYRHAANDERWVIARFNANGTLDTTGFGAPNGYVLTDHPNDYAAIVDVALDASGRIVALGRAYDNTEVRVTRYLSNGALDTTSFGAPNGWVVYDHPGCCFDFPEDVLVDSAGRILWVGRAGDGTGIVRRLQSSGADDGTFGTSGTLTVDFGADDAAVTSIIERSTGGYVITGTRLSATNNVGFVRGLEDDGDPDGTFGTGGTTTFDLSPANDWWWWADDNVRSIVELGDGAFRIAGRTWSGTDYIAYLGALSPTGTLDEGFAQDGIRMMTEAHIEHPQVIDAGDGSIHVAASDVITRHGGTTVPDYASGGTWGTGSNAFGACLVDASAGAVTNGTTWSEDVDNDCRDGDGDPWRAIPATTGDAAAKVAQSAQQLTHARVDLRFGFRTATNQRPGRYVAPIRFEVVAPQS